MAKVDNDFWQIHGMGYISHLNFDPYELQEDNGSLRSIFLEDDDNVGQPIAKNKICHTHLQKYQMAKRRVEIVHS